MRQVGLQPRKLEAVLVSGAPLLTDVVGRRSHQERADRGGAFCRFAAPSIQAQNGEMTGRRGTL